MDDKSVIANRCSGNDRTAIFRTVCDQSRNGAATRQPTGCHWSTQAARRVGLTNAIPAVEYNVAVVAHQSAVRRTLITVALAGAISFIATACSDGEPEVTRADLLTEIEGRSLSEAEIEERESVARALCQMDDDVLRAVWAEMDNDQLAFQDFVFTQECGDRNPLYADSTGRFATDG